MNSEIKDYWYEVGDSCIYTTGHYLVDQKEVKMILQHDTFENDKNLLRAENKELIVTSLKSDKRILVYFFPLKNNDRFLMETNISNSAFEIIDDILPQQIKRILKKKSPIIYHN